MENEKNKDKASPQNRMEQDVKHTSRTMQPGNIQDSGGTQNSTNTAKGKGRGWHGDSEGHAKAGSQSHKKSDDKEA